MSYTSNIVFDQVVQGGQIYISDTFTKARFIVIDTVDLPQEQAYELGFSLVINIPVMGRVISKNIALLPEEIQGVFDTFYIIPIPDSLYNSQYECYCTIGFGTDCSSTTIRIYVYTSETTEETVNNKLDEILTELKAIRKILENTES